MAAALKAVVFARAPWVRILLPPPYNVFTEFYKTVERVSNPLYRNKKPQSGFQTRFNIIKNCRAGFKPALL